MDTKTYNYKGYLISRVTFNREKFYMVWRDGKRLNTETRLNTLMQAKIFADNYQA